MTKPLSIFWFRQDLRLSDNPALVQAIASGTVLPIFILDDDNAGAHALGGASRWWLHHSLDALNKDLGGTLSFYKGRAEDVIASLCERLSIHSVFWNRCYEPWRMTRDQAIKTALKETGIAVESHNGSLLWEPWTITKSDGTPYKVFTPFYRKGCLKAPAPRTPIEVPNLSDTIFDKEGSLALTDLDLLPNIPWDQAFHAHWTPGEKGAHQRLSDFIKEGLANYKEGRNIPAKPYVSRLSPCLHFGEISPNQIWYSLRTLGDNKHIDHYCSELGWREFSHQLLFHNHNLATQNLQVKFDAFPWVKDDQALLAWQKGKTGIPMVDAGMRELWQTGYMHNRVRMIVGSFLVKNLRLSWHHGERWFWECLLDADYANNAASWQWIAGCGADAAPYFRIFNPVTQGAKFDPDGDYIRTYVPELAKLPTKFLFNPWEAPALVLQEAGIVMGETYPLPIVDLKQSREAALAAFQSLKFSASA